MKLRWTFPLLMAVMLPIPVFAASGGSVASDPGAMEGKHFHPKGKPPSEHTLEGPREARATLPFSDKRDFEEEQKGFIAAPDSWQIKARDGDVVWDMERYKFFLEGKAFPSIHPSLQRQSTLNMNYGLYEVMPGFYQVRGFDLANITFVKGETGWIVFDPLTAAETARAAQEAGRRASGRAPGRGRGLLPFPRRPLGWRARHRRRGRRAGRARCRSSRRATSWRTPSPRTSTPATR